MAEETTGYQKSHLPVLYHEIILALHPFSPGHYVDGTVGAGGHAWGILDACKPEGRLLGLDVDPQALELANQRLSVFGERATLIRASYATLSEQLRHLGWSGVQGIVLDLGASSIQFDSAERGFSFQNEGPLDMRFNPSQLTTAAELVNNLTEQKLADLLWLYGEEPASRRIAHEIGLARPLLTTHQLADAVQRAVRKHRGHLHPATRTFQALRIAVNQELQSLEMVLPQSITALAPEGRLAVISFHSLEDRLVKQFFRRESRDCICPPEQPVCTCQHKASLVEITRHPISPTEAEIQSNPRARSAHLRIAEKI
jgi:16S rRNA (cytosine1402-N4)-methyltransferase